MLSRVVCALNISDTPSPDLSLDQAQFPAGLTRNRTVLLCPPHQVGDHVFNGTERPVFASRSPGPGQVEGEVIAHPLPWGEMHVRVVMGQSFFIEQFCRVPVAVFIVRCHDQRNPVEAPDAECYSSVKIPVGGFLVWLYR